MAENEVFSELIKIFRNVFNDDELVVTYKTNSDQLENWDSLNHIHLMSAIEKKFNIKFALGELIELKDVEAIIKLMLNEKLKSI